jgi:hypothetical protein
VRADIPVEASDAHEFIKRTGNMVGVYSQYYPLAKRARDATFALSKLVSPIISARKKVEAKRYAEIYSNAVASYRDLLSELKAAKEEIDRRAAESRANAIHIDSSEIGRAISADAASRRNHSGHHISWTGD